MLPSLASSDFKTETGVLPFMHWVPARELRRAASGVNCATLRFQANSPVAKHPALPDRPANEEIPRQIVEKLPYF
jgi:hypothetical protein